MPRNGSGSYTLPEAPFVPLTTISSAAVNSDFNDIATALTASLARDGQGGMTAVLPLATAGFTYTADTNTGMYRTGSDEQAIKCGGTDIVSITTTGVNVTGTISQDGNPLIPIGFGPSPWSRPTAPAGWALCYGQPCTSAYAAYRAILIADGSPYGNNGTDPLFPDMRGNTPIGKTNMGGSTRTNITSTYFGADPTVLASQGGGESVTFARANLPAINFTNSGIAVSISNGGQNATPLKSDGPGSGPGNASAQGTADSATSSVVNAPALTANVTSQGAAASGGSGTPFSRVQPGIILNYIIYVGV